VDGRNWREIDLSTGGDALVRRGAELYKQTYLDAFDNVFVIAKAIDILQQHNYGTGVQGGFAAALMQYGFTTRDGLAPIDKSIRSNFKALLDNEPRVRAWWQTVPESKKRDWLSARAIYRNWQASLKPKQPKGAQTTWPNRPVVAEPKTEEQIRAQSNIGKPSPEAMKAREQANAEAEAAQLAAKQQPQSEALQHKIAELERTVSEFQSTIDKWRDTVETQKIIISKLQNENTSLRAGATTSPEPTQPQTLDQLFAHAVDVMAGLDAATNQINNWPDKISERTRTKHAREVRDMLTRLRGLRSLGNAVARGRSHETMVRSPEKAAWRVAGLGSGARGPRRRAAPCHRQCVDFCQYVCQLKCQQACQLWNPT
jgi:hypothetical protein